MSADQHEFVAIELVFAAGAIKRNPAFANPPVKC